MPIFKVLLLGVSTSAILVRMFANSTLAIPISIGNPVQNNFIAESTFS